MAALQVLKIGKHFTIYTDGSQKLIKLYGRASYPAFGEKKRNEDAVTGKVSEKWGGVVMLPKSTHQEAYAAVKSMIDEIKANTLNDKTGKKGLVIAPENLFLRDGDEKEDEAMHGHWLVTFSDSQRQPACRKPNGELILDKGEIDQQFYGGCWINVLLRPWYFNGKAKNDPKSYPKRILAGFTGAQFIKDDTPFGSGRIDDSDAWGSVDEGGDDGLGADDDL